MDDGFVYFVKAGTEFVKIGFSKNPDIRISSIRSDNPLPIKLLGVMPGNSKTEKEVQKAFSRHRIRGEWFDFCEKIKSYIDENTSAYNLKIKRYYKTDNTRTQFSVYMSPENISYLKHISNKDDVSMSSIINNLIAKRRL